MLCIVSRQSVVAIAIHDTLYRRAKYLDHEPKERYGQQQQHQQQKWLLMIGRATKQATK